MLFLSSINGITCPEEFFIFRLNSEKVGAYFQGFTGKTLDFNALGLRHIMLHYNYRHSR